MKKKAEEDRKKLKRANSERSNLTQSGAAPRSNYFDPTPAIGLQRPGSTPSQRSQLPPTQPLTHVTSDLPPYKFRTPNHITPIKIPLSHSEGIPRSNSISPRNDRTKVNRTPTYELYNPPFLRPAEGAENQEPVSPRRPLSSSPPTPNGTDSSTSPRSGTGSGYESSGKLRTGTSSMNIFVDDEDRNKSRTPRMDVKVERNVLNMLDRIAEEEDNIVVNDEDEDGQKIQKQPPKQVEEEAEDSGSGPESTTDSPSMEVLKF